DVCVAMRLGASYSTHLPSRVPAPRSSGRVASRARHASAFERARRMLAYGTLALGCSGLRGDATRDSGEPSNGEGSSGSTGGSASTNGGSSSSGVGGNPGFGAPGSSAGGLSAGAGGCRASSGAGAASPFVAPCAAGSMSGQADYGSGDAPPAGTSGIGSDAGGGGAAVIDLELRGSTGNGVIGLEWKRVPGALGYRVYWSTEEPLELATADVLETEEPGVVHRGLVNGMTYRYVVR